MPRTVRAALPALVVICGLTLAWPLGAAAPTAKPEEVGLSTERLKRVAELVQRHVSAGSFSGAVTLVARHGRIAHHEAHGLMDLDPKKPMVRDGIFRIMSMTKPVIGVAVLMMMEEGKVRLQDPVSRFVPEWRDMTVAVDPPSGRPGARHGQRRARASDLEFRARSSRPSAPPWMLPGPIRIRRSQGGAPPSRAGRPGRRFERAIPGLHRSVCLLDGNRNARYSWQE